MMARLVAITGVTALGATGCAAPQASPEFTVAEILRLDAQMVNILVETTGRSAEERLTPYADCVVAQYALDEGFGFARNIRTYLSKTGGTWAADAVYSISPALPRGSRTIDAEVAVQNCAELGIPTG